MLKKSKAVTLICGATSIIVTIIFYLLTFDNIFTIPMRWTSLMFLIFAEIIGTVKALSIKKSIFGISSIIVSLFHLGIVLAISIIFVNTFPTLIRKYVLINLLLLSVMLAVDVIIIYFGKYIGSKNKVLSQNQTIAGNLYTIAMGLAIEYKESGYNGDLNEICELLKYSDNSELSGDEVLISERLEELRKLLSDNDESIPEKILDIKKTIKLRSLKIKSTKRGSY
jgi:hypothetical protein